MLFLDRYTLLQVALYLTSCKIFNTIKTLKMHSIVLLKVFNYKLKLNDAFICPPKVVHVHCMTDRKSHNSSCLFDEQLNEDFFY